MAVKKNTKHQGKKKSTHTKNPVSRHNHNWDQLWVKSKSQMKHGIKRVNYMNIRIVKEVKKLLSIKNKDSFEIGAGSGRLSWMLLRSGMSSVTLLDTSKEGLKLARTLFTKEEQKRTHFLHRSIFEFDSKKKYDLVVSGATIQHFKDENLKLIIQKHYALTKSGGVCVMVFPSSNYFNVRREKSKKNRSLYGWFDTSLEKKVKNYLPTNEYIQYRFDLFYGKPKLLLYLHRVIYHLTKIDLNIRYFDKRFGGLVFLALKKP